MNLTPAEQEALDSIGAPPTTRTIRTVIAGFHTGVGGVHLTIPVPRGPEYAIGDRVTITFEENR